MTALPKPQKRYRASLNEWGQMREWFVLERCWVCGGKWTELHHIYPRGQGGDDVVENLAPLCTSCHNRVEARDPLARGRVRQALMPSNLDYLIGKLGENTRGWLERNYAVFYECEPCECAGANPECKTCYGPRAA